MPRAQPIKHVLIYHRPRRRRGCHAGYDSSEAGSPDAENSCSCDSFIHHLCLLFSKTTVTLNNTNTDIVFDNRATLRRRKRSGVDLTKVDIQATQSLIDFYNSCKRRDRDVVHITERLVDRSSSFEIYGTSQLASSKSMSSRLTGNGYEAC